MSAAQWRYKPVFVYDGKLWRRGIGLRSCKVHGQERIEVTSGGRRFIVPETDIKPRIESGGIAAVPALTPAQMSAQTNLFLEVA